MSGLIHDFFKLLLTEFSDLIPKDVHKDLRLLNAAT